MKLTYNVQDKPKFGQMIVFGFQQLLAILAATIAVPSIIGNGMSQSAALFGAGVGTIVYLLFTKFRSPAFLGSAFAFIGSMFAAFGGAASAQAGHAGLIIGAVFAGLVYVVIAIAVMTQVTSQVIKDGAIVDEVSSVSAASPYVALICGLVTLFTVVLCSVYGKKMAKLIPFIIGICAGYLTATIFTIIGTKTGNTALQVIDFTVFHDQRTVYRNGCGCLCSGCIRSIR